MMKTLTNLLPAIAISAVAIVAVPQLHAASIVKAAYSHNGEQVALMIYTGSDGGPTSDREGYWKLLGKAPESASKVKIKPDKADGKTATLKGDVSVSVEIRNKFNMGVAKTDKLTLVRENTEFTRWYIPAKELKRIVALIDKKPAESKPEAEKDSADPPTTTSESKSGGKTKTKTKPEQ